MDFKFVTGQTVSHKPMGQRSSTFTVVRQMPEEPRSSSDLKYRIKSTSEGFERIVSEVDLEDAATAVGSSEVERLFVKG
jgi:hypothetical protein